MSSLLFLTLSHTRTHKRDALRHSETEPLTRVRAGCRHGHFENWFLPVSSTKLVRSTAMQESAKREREGRCIENANEVLIVNMNAKSLLSDH